MFLFGPHRGTSREPARAWYSPYWHYENEPETRAALDPIFFGSLQPLTNQVCSNHCARRLMTNGDHYMHLAALTSYCQAHERLGAFVCGSWRMGAPKRFLNVASSGKFSSDPHYCRVRIRHLEGGTIPNILETHVMTSEGNGMTISPLAGKPAPKEMLIDVARLEREYLSAIRTCMIPTN